MQGHNLTLYNCNFWGHDIPVSLSGLGILKTVVKQAIEGELSRQSFTRTVRGVRRPRRYYRNLVNKLIAAGKYRTALRLVDQRLPKKVDYNYFMLRKAVILSHLGDVEQMSQILMQYEAVPVTRKAKK